MPEKSRVVGVIPDPARKTKIEGNSVGQGPRGGAKPPSKRAIRRVISGTKAQGFGPLRQYYYIL